MFNGDGSPHGAAWGPFNAIAGGDTDKTSRFQPDILGDSVERAPLRSFYA